MSSKKCDFLNMWIKETLDNRTLLLRKNVEDFFVNNQNLIEHFGKFWSLIS